MFFGTSKDFGTCKSMKKNGEKCNSIVNVNRCEFCVYHIKQEYQKCSQRSDLQSHFVGKGLVALRNKVLGKNEVFYAGKSYMAIPTKKSKKLEQKDNHRLDILNGLSSFSNNIVKAKNRAPSKKKQNAARLDVSVAQRKRDLELLKKLAGASDIESKTNFSGNHSSDVLTLEESKNLALSVISKLKAKKFETPKPPSQYERTSDLIVNVDIKKSFTGKVSEDVTLDESRTLAKNVIAKLKGKKTNIEETIATNVDENQRENDNNDDIFNEAFELEYDDDEVGASKKNSKGFETERENMSEKREPDNVEKISGAKIVSPLNNKKSTNVSRKENASPVSQKPASKHISSPKQSNGTVQDKQNKNFSKTYKKMSDISSPKNSDVALKNKDILSPKNSNVSSNNNEILSPKSSKVPSTNLKTFENDLSNISSSPKLSTVPTLSCFSSVNSSPNLSNVPTLSCFGAKNGLIDLNEPVRKNTMNRAKLNAIKFVQSNGPIKKIDPNSTKNPTTSVKKRFTPDSVVEELNPKKSKLAESEFISDRFKRMMATTSRHTDLLEQRDDDEQEKYFKKQEMKEQMEEKMANTFKIACKAVRCLKCKYTSFSASDLCKKEGHPLRVFDATKRFFKCGNCQNRTVSLEIVPTTPCKNCGSGKWERTGMMKEKVIGVAHQLSIRGGEQKFVNSVVTDANINLLVAESD